LRRVRHRAVIWLTRAGASFPFIAAKFNLGRTSLFAEAVVAQGDHRLHPGRLMSHLFANIARDPRLFEEASMKTLYELLGVCPDAGDEALKVAYRSRAKMHHPDLNPNDPDAARRFRQLAAAIEVLCDGKRRAAYNQRLVCELQHRLDREKEQRRSQTPRMIAVSAAAGVAIGVVSVDALVSLRPVAPIAVVVSGATDDVVQRPVMASTTMQEGLSRERSNDGIEALAKPVSPPQASPDRGEVKVPPDHLCQHETAGGGSREAGGLLMAEYDVERLEMEPGCKSLEGREANERELSANERAALIRQAQELLANGDARGAHLLSRRACRDPRSRCGLGSG
jgi:DnaJ domain